MKKWTKYAIVSLCLLLALTWGLVFAERYVPNQIKEKALEGEPYLFYEESKHWCGISRMAAKDGFLYLLHDDRKMLCIYDTEGNYQHSYCFAECENGRPSVFVLNGIVHYQDRGQNYYTLENGIVTNYEAASSELYRAMTQPQRQAEKLPVSDGDAVYELRGASVWKCSADGTEVEIIHRPGWLVVFQGNCFMYLSCAAVLSLFVLVILKQKNYI